MNCKRIIGRYIGFLANVTFKEGVDRNPSNEGEEEAGEEAEKHLNRNQTKQDQLSIGNSVQAGHFKEKLSMFPSPLAVRYFGQVSSFNSFSSHIFLKILKYNNMSRKGELPLLFKLVSFPITSGIEGSRASTLLRLSPGLQNVWLQSSTVHETSAQTLTESVILEDPKNIWPHLNIYDF